MVLITNKTSNILQDIDTLSLFARVVVEYCRSQNEKEIQKQAFELLAVFDEIVSLGFIHTVTHSYRENVSLGQIRTISAMESHDERIQAEIAREKEKEAKEEIKRKAKQIDMRKREESRKISNADRYGGFDNNRGLGYNSNNAAPVYQTNVPQYTATPAQPAYNPYAVPKYCCILF